MAFLFWVFLLIIPISCQVDKTPFALYDIDDLTKEQKDTINYHIRQKIKTFYTIDVYQNMLIHPMYLILTEYDSLNLYKNGFDNFVNLCTYTMFTIMFKKFQYDSNFQTDQIFLTHPVDLTEFSKKISSFKPNQYMISSFLNRFLYIFDILSNEFIRIEGEWKQYLTSILYVIYENELNTTSSPYLYPHYKVMPNDLYNIKKETIGHYFESFKIDNQRCAFFIYFIYQLDIIQACSLNYATQFQNSHLDSNCIQIINIWKICMPQDISFFTTAFSHQTDWLMENKFLPYESIFSRYRSSHDITIAERVSLHYSLVVKDDRGDLLCEDTINLPLFDFQYNMKSIQYFDHAQIPAWESIWEWQYNAFGMIASLCKKLILSELLPKLKNPDLDPDSFLTNLVPIKFTKQNPVSTFYPKPRLTSVCYWAPSLICLNTLKYPATNIINFLTNKIPYLFFGGYMWMNNYVTPSNFPTNCWHFLHEFCRRVINKYRRFLGTYAAYWAQEELLQNQQIPLSYIYKFKNKLTSNDRTDVAYLPYKLSKPHELINTCLWLPYQWCTLEPTLSSNNNITTYLAHIIVTHPTLNFNPNIFINELHQYLKSNTECIANTRIWCSKMAKYRNLPALEAAKLQFIFRSYNSDTIPPCTLRTNILTKKIMTYMKKRTRPSIKVPLSNSYFDWPWNL